MQTTQSLESPTANLTIDNLTPFTAYNVTSLPFTVVGSGTPSPPLQLLTDQAAPAAAPAFQTERVTSTRINVSWSEVALPDANGIITAYSVINADTNIVLCATTALTCTIASLAPGTTYQLQLAASTITGAGPRSALRAVRTLDAVPAGLSRPLIRNVTDRAATLSWASPTEPNGVILKHEISAITSQSERLIEVEGSALEYQISGLQPATEYAFKLRAYTSLGASEYTASVNATTLETGELRGNALLIT